MALGMSPRGDARRFSSSYCSKVTLLVFVALTMVGIWMMTSSVAFPFKIVDISAAGVKSQVNEQLVMNAPHEFEDGLGDIPRKAMGSDWDGNTVDENGFQENESEKLDKKITEKITIETSGDNFDKNLVDITTKRSGVGGDEKFGDKNGGQSTLVREETQEDKDTSSESKGLDAIAGERNVTGQAGSQEEKSEGEERSGLNTVGTTMDETNQGIELKKNYNEKNKDNINDLRSKEVFPDGAQSELLNETSTQNGAWSTQATESKNEKELLKHLVLQDQTTVVEDSFVYHWNLCNVTAGQDYIPCLDNLKAIKKLPSTSHYEHRERHCPTVAPTCLVPLPKGYKRPIEWPKSRDKIWYSNVPHTSLAEVKGHQNWVKVSGEYLTFPGGGTQFVHGVSHYIDVIQKSLPDIAWGKKSRVVLDVGCGVASFGGALFDRDVLTMSFAPKDEHEAQVQFALERGIPAISAVMGTKRLPFPSKVFDVVHCARCRVPWHIEGGKLLLELNRVMRPGGFFIWSATPVYRKGAVDVGIWNAMSEITKMMCWELVAVKKDTLNGVGIAIYKKPSSNSCYEKRTEDNPPLCEEKDDPDAAWNVPLQACVHRIPSAASERGYHWPDLWPLRLDKSPYWLNNSHIGVYGKAAPEDFIEDYKHWKRVVSNSYLNGMGINWSMVRNVMDMRSVYGGFAAALRDIKVWVLNVVAIDSPDTLPLIYERGLFGIYHDWCESFSTYPRTYDLLHADHLFSNVKKRCKLVSVMAEVDRILRPEGTLIVRDKIDTITELETMAKSLYWDVRLTYSKDLEGLLCLQKTMWRPKEFETTV